MSGLWVLQRAVAVPRISEFFGIVISMYYNDHAPPHFHRVKSVRPLDGFKLDVEFTDGSQRVVDVDRYLRGPVFEPVRRDRAMFEAVTVDAELGVVVWPNGADIDPDVLFGLHEPMWADQDAASDG